MTGRVCSECGASLDGMHGLRVVCSDDCRVARQRRVTPPFRRDVRQRENRRRAMRATKVCLMCGGPLPPELKSRRTCSDECTASRVRSWHAWTEALARSPVRGGHVRFDPFIVFDRDGWRCIDCGIETPRELRGSNRPNSPELDHRIPLGAGGLHTPENSGCCCRHCNAAKLSADKILIAAIKKGVPNAAQSQA